MMGISLKCISQLNPITKTSSVREKRKREIVRGIIYVIFITNVSQKKRWNDLLKEALSDWFCKITHMNVRNLFYGESLRNSRVLVKTRVRPP